MAEVSASPVPLEEEIEGDRSSTADFVFCRIGESVPLKLSDSAFDLQSPPSRPLAVSERHRALFLAHSEGFMVARTKDVIGLANEIKEKGKGPCVQGSSIVDVKIGRVSILALSKDSSFLAATVGGDIRVYSVSSLLGKNQELIFSCSLNKSGIVKDLRWQKNVEKSFVVISSDGSLYHGQLEDDLKDLMDNVDAVDWSTECDSIAVAKRNTISILSSDFKEQFSMSLLFQSWPSEADLECVIKVDSVVWLRDDSIIVGCVRADNDGNEEGYLVQVITSREHKFTESSCKPIVFSFPDLFQGVSDNILPGGSGPYLLLSYFDHWELVLASNKKNIEEHVELLKWLTGDGERKILSLEFQNDKYMPRIDLQENGDDNVLLGFAVDKISIYEKVRIQQDNEYKELSPHGVLLCLTSEGKLIMYHAARISEPSELLQSSVPTLDGCNTERERLSAEISTENDLLETTSAAKKDRDGLVTNNRFKLTGTEAPVKYSGKELESAGNKEPCEVPGNNVFADKEKQSAGGSLFGLPLGQVAKVTQSPLVSPLISGSGSAPRNNIKPGMQEHKFTPIERGFNATSLVSNVSGETTTSRQDNTKDITRSGELGKDNTKIMTQGGEWGKGFLGSSGSVGTSFGSQSTGKPFASDCFNAKPSAIASDLSGGRVFNSNGSSREPSSFLFSSDKDAQRDGRTTTWTKTANAEAAPAISRSAVSTKGSVEGKLQHFKAQPFVDNTRNLKSPPMLDSEPELSKQFYNVKDMAKELDTLLSFIEQEGGFRDACTRSQQSSLLALEEGLQNLSEISRMCKSKIEEQIIEIQELQNKMSQVSARQVYMESIVRQATDRQYWDIWNRQKLSPELELKRQNILNANQNLTNQLIELERHFNSLEINRFGESSRLPAGRRKFHNNSGPSRENLSLHSVYNTLNSQLAAAEQLSECLSKQMAMLNIKSPTVKQGGVAKELFESIGLAHGANAFRSPDVKKSGLTPDSVKRFTPSTKEHSRISLSSALRSVEPETARRRRDSLDRSWASFEPQKTTVKRISHEERSRISANTPFRRAKEAFDSQMASIAVIKKKDDETPASSLPQTSISKFLSHESSTTGGVQDRFSRQALASQSGSLFQPAKDYSISSRTPESTSSPVHDVRKSAKPPTLMASSPSLLISTQSAITCMANYGASHMGGQSNSVPKISTVQQETSTPTLTFSKFSNAISPLNTTSTVEIKGQASKQLNMKSGEDSATKTFPQSFSTLSNESNISSAPSISAAPSAGNIAQTENKVSSKDWSTESVSAFSSFQSRISASSLSLPVPSLTPATSTSGSASIMPSLLPSSLPAMGFGGSPNAKSVGETSGTSSASPSTSIAALLSSTGSSLQSLQSPVSKPFASISENVAPHSQYLQPPTPQAPANEVLVQQNKSSTKPEPAVSQAAVSEGVVGLASVRKRDLLPATSGSALPAASDSQSGTQSAVAPPSNTMASEENEELDTSLSQEDEMEEEAPDTTNALNLGALGGFGLGSASPSSVPKSNPFGGSLVTAITSSASSPLSFTSSPGELFRPASFSLSSAQPIQPSQAISSGAFSGAFSGTTGGFSGLGQPAQVGAGQQALGSVLGAFGQSRQLGAGAQGFGFASPAAPSGGGFASLASKGGGFAAAATGGSFAAGSPSVGGFGGAAMGGGFAAVAPSSGGFAGAATGKGFAVVAPGTGGFGGATSAGGGFGGSGQGGGLPAGGFSAFSSNQGSSFSAFGGNGAAGAGRPPENLFTQMRK